jgi:hypothetical protein
MPDRVDRRNLRVTGRHRAITDASHLAALEEQGGVTVIVTQAFGPRGDNLIGIRSVAFDGHPALTIGVEVGTRRGEVHLSPIHGDSRKTGFVEIPPGTKCRLYCPVSGAPLDRVSGVEGDEGTDYYAIYLTPQLSAGSMVAISDIWGHYHSRIVDNFELISLWLRDG